MSRFEIRQTNKGRGVFTLQPIKSGELIIEWTGPRLSTSELPHPYQSVDDLYTQVGENIFIGPSGDIDDIINHSCDPNCGMRFEKDRINLIAIKNIAPEEELSWDYATTMNMSGINAIDNWEMLCKCGLSSCRGVIRSFEILPNKIKEKYINLGIVPEYIIHAKN